MINYTSSLLIFGFAANYKLLITNIWQSFWEEDNTPNYILFDVPVCFLSVQIEILQHNILRACYLVSFFNMIEF